MNGLTALLMAVTLIAVFEALRTAADNSRLRREIGNMEHLINHYKLEINSMYGGNADGMVHIEEKHNNNQQGKENKQ